MTPQQDDDILLITRKEFVELANVHTEGISPARIFEITLAVKDRSSHPAPSPQFTPTEQALIDACMETTEDPASRPATSPEPKFNSTDLLLLANDEWKRREERKHNHENAPWCAGFINGFMTDKKWAREMVDKIQKDAEDKLRTEGGDE